MIQSKVKASWWIDDVILDLLIWWKIRNSGEFGPPNYSIINIHNPPILQYYPTSTFYTWYGPRNNSQNLCSMDGSIELWPEIGPTPKFISENPDTHQSVTAFPYPISIITQPIAQPCTAFSLPPCIFTHSSASISQQFLFHCVPWPLFQP